MTTASLTLTDPVTALLRVFKLGAIELPDVARELEPLQSLRLHADNYPHLRTASLAEPYVEGDRLVYPVEKQPVETKGAL